MQFISYKATALKTIMLHAKYKILMEHCLEVINGRHADKEWEAINYKGRFYKIIKWHMASETRWKCKKKFKKKKGRSDM